MAQCSKNDDRIMLQNDDRIMLQKDDKMLQNSLLDIWGTKFTVAKFTV